MSEQQSNVMPTPIEGVSCAICTRHIYPRDRAMFLLPHCSLDVCGRCIRDLAPDLYAELGERDIDAMAA